MKGYNTIQSWGLALLVASGLCVTGCNIHKGSESQLKEDIDSFATHYYNWHFDKAAAYCTPESERWLKFAATNVRKADIDSLQAKTADADVNVNDVNFDDNDSTASVIVEVNDFLQMDSIGQAAHPISQASFIIPMVLRHDKWMVKLEGLPRKDSPRRSGN